MLVISGDDERVDPPHTDRTATRGKILDAAEMLFARSGFDGTSVRDVTSLVEISPGAINYYFGSKAGLIRAVLKRVADALNGERLARLDELEANADAGPLPVEAVLRAFLEPLLRGFSPQRREIISRLLAHVSAATDAQLGTYWLELFGPIGKRFIEAFRRSAPHLTIEDVFWRYQFMLIATYDSRIYADWFRDWLRDLFDIDTTADTLEQRVVAFTAMFNAQPVVPGQAVGVSPTSSTNQKISA